MLATILAPTSGRARVDGVDVSEDPLEVRRRIGFLSGSDRALPAPDRRARRCEYFGRLHGLEGDELEARVEELHRRVRPEGLRRRPLREALSTGQKQRVSIARAVLHDPPVLILDEPTTGLDMLASSDDDRLHRVAREAGRCVLFSTHILSEAERLCDRIGIIDDGRMLAVGSLEELRAMTGATWLEDVFRVLVGADADRDGAGERRLRIARRPAERAAPARARPARALLGGRPAGAACTRGSSGSAASRDREARRWPSARRSWSPSTGSTP